MILAWTNMVQWNPINLILAVCFKHLWVTENTINFILILVIYLPTVYQLKSCMAIEKNQNKSNYLKKTWQHQLVHVYNENLLFLRFTHTIFPFKDIVTCRPTKRRHVIKKYTVQKSAMQWWKKLDGYNIPHSQMGPTLTIYIHMYDGD